MRKTDPEKKATIYYCDRCKKAFAESSPLGRDPGENKVSRGVSLPMPIINGDELGFRNEDFCGSCVRSLWKWRNEKKVWKKKKR